MESELLRKMHRKVVRNFLDVLILLELKNSALTGFDIASFIHKRFNVSISPETIYSCLFGLEKEGLIRGEQTKRKRVYHLTDEGKQTVKMLLKMKNKILGLVINLFISE